MINKFTFLKYILFFGFLDTFSILFLIILYLTGVDLLFLVNINFFTIFIIIVLGSMVGKIHINGYILFFLSLLFVSILKVLLLISIDNIINIYYIFTYFYSLLLMIFSFMFVSRFTNDDYEKVLHYFRTFAYYYLSMATIFLIVYIFLYFSGKISYFGMGSNLHIVVPFFMKSGGSFFFFFFALIIIFSGKRAVLINYLVQYLFYFVSYFKKRKILLSFLVVFIVIGIMYLNQTTNIFYRFEALLNVDFSDAYSRLLAFGGRFEEIIGIYDFFNENIWKIFFGSIPGDFYLWILDSYNGSGVVTNSYNEPKNYAHLTVVSFLFRYGIIFTSIAIIFLIYIVIKYYNHKSEFYLVFIGILSSSFFGANLLTDPISWIMLAFFFKYKDIKGNL